MILLCSLQHDAGAVICDSDLSSQLKSATYSALKKMEGDIQDEVPTLMSGAGHDAMAISHLTKVTNFCSLYFGFFFEMQFTLQNLTMNEDLNRWECCLCDVVEESVTLLKNMC